MAITATNKQLTNPKHVEQVLLTAIEENVLLEVTIQPSGIRTQAFLVCDDGNIGSHHSLLLTTLGDVSGNKAYRESASVTIQTQTARYVVDLETRFLELTTVNGASCVRLGFPRSVRIAPHGREFNRLRIPYVTDLNTTVKLKDGRQFKAAVFDLAMGGCSLIRQVDADVPSGAERGVMVRIVIHSPDKSNNYEILINGVIRRLIQLRNRYNELQELIGIEFTLISVSSRRDFNSLMHFVKAEVQRASEGTNPVLERCVTTADRQAERARLQREYPDVHQAIESGDDEMMLSMLAIWKLDQSIRYFLVQGLIERSAPGSLIAALKQIVEVEWCKDADLLMAAIAEKQHVPSATSALKLLPAGSRFLEPLVSIITREATADRLLKAVQNCQDKPKVQYRLLPTLIKSGTVPHLVEAFKVVPEDSPVAKMLVEVILKKYRAVAELVPIIQGLTDVSSELYISVIQKFVKYAPVVEMVQLLKNQISDQTRAGEFLAVEIVSRGKPEDMLLAFGETTMDSFTSVVLAYGLARFGSQKQIDEALTMVGHLPRAGVILKHAQLRRALRKESKLLKMLNIGGGEQKKQLDALESDARLLLSQADQELRRMSEMVHGVLSSKLQQHLASGE